MHARLTSHALATAALLLLAALPAAAGPGHDHGEGATPAAATALPRFAATSDQFELVGTLDGRQLTLYLDHAADNRPVDGATLALELDGTAVPVQPHGAGTFEATLAAAPAPGEIAVTATVQAGGASDLLAGELDIHDDAAAPAAKVGRGWKPLAAGAVLLAVAVAAFGLRRGRRQRQRIGGAA